MKKETEPFYFLRETVQLVVIDDDPSIRGLITEILRPHILFKIHSAVNSVEAEALFQTPFRMHVCTLDLGLNDLSNDEFFILRKYNSKVAFVIFTGSPSPQKGFEAHQLGAKAILEKRGGFDRAHFVRTVNKMALRSIINPNHSIKSDSLALATETLIAKAPKFVAEWAEMIGITDRMLRLLWTKNLGANAKIILSIFHIYNSAFRYNEQHLLDKNEAIREEMLKSANYKYLEEFFFLHRSAILDYISYSNIALFP